MQYFVALSGSPVTKARIVVPEYGIGFAELELEKAAPISGTKVLTVAGLSIVCTPEEAASGSHGLRRRCVVVFGANGWQKPLKRRMFANDVGVKARSVAVELARECGETIGNFAETGAVLGKTYTRQDGLSASETLTEIVGSEWWVDYDGRTNVGPRPVTRIAPGAAKVLNFDPSSRVVSLSLEKPEAIRPGLELVEGLDAPEVIRELEITIDGDKLTCSATVSSEAGEAGIAAKFRAIFDHFFSRRLFGHYRYRVISTLPDRRVNLQAVEKEAGLPDVVKASVWGSVGISGRMRGGTEVLVVFLRGRRSGAIVVNAAPPDDPMHVPEELILAGGTRYAVGVGDSVDFVFPDVVPVTGIITPPGSSFAGVLNMSAVRAAGIIVEGLNRKVKIP